MAYITPYHATGYLWPRGGHTHTHTHAYRHADQSNFKKPGARSQRPCVSGLKSARFSFFQLSVWTPLLFHQPYSLLYHNIVLNIERCLGSFLSEYQ